MRLARPSLFTRRRRTDAPDSGDTPSQAPLRPQRSARWQQVRRIAGRTTRKLALISAWLGAPIVIGLLASRGEGAVTVAPEVMGGTVKEVTGLYSVHVAEVRTPTTTEEVAEAIRTTSGPVSIGGGRYSMGGQTATLEGLQLDLRQLHGVIALDTIADTVRVYAGTRWRELQEALDPAGRAVKVMQTYNNFTVGGALSVNAHGRYIGLGPISQTVRSVRVVLASGQVIDATRSVRPEVYAAALGGYGAIGVITEVTLDVARNVRVRRSWERLPLANYPTYFDQQIAGTAGSDTAVIFHNGDLAPPAYDQVGALTYRKTEAPVTEPEHLRPPDQSSRLFQIGFSGMGDPTWGPFTRWLRRTVIDPVLWSGHPVTWRNYEASYDVSELEPQSREKRTFVLQEYFVPKDSLVGAVKALGVVLRGHRVDAINISIRHALADTLPMLTWAPTETFALVLYYAQGTQPEDRDRVGTWTREAIDSVLAHGGRYYLPYQLHATRSQFLRAYPRALDLFRLKQELDPAGRFTNTLWDLYAPAPSTSAFMTTAPMAPPLPVTPQRLPAVVPAEVRLAIDSLPGYQRNTLASVISHPEWDLVYSSDALRDWMAAGGSPSDFSWMRSIGTFWRSYSAAWREVRRVGEVPSGFHSMLLTIGVSTTVEYALTALYEQTIGRFSGWIGGGHRTATDELAAAQAASYSDLIHQAGWYRFDFWPWVERLWQTPLGSGRQALRGLERRLWLSAVWSVKALYAQLLTVAMGEEQDTLTRHLLVAGVPPTDLDETVRVSPPLWRDYHLLEVPRYAPYEALLDALASRSDSVRIVEINGAPTTTLSLRVPAGQVFPPQVRVLAAYPAVPDTPSGPALTRVLIQVPVLDLQEVLEVMLSTPGVRVDHRSDF